MRRPRRSLRFTRDDELVRLVRAGDECAFEAIYDRHHRGILAFSRHMLGSREEAEDAVQHTFIAAHRDLAGSDKPIQLKAWLYTIARNRCLSVLRARKEERALEDVPEPSVEGLASEVQRRQDLRDMLADLQRLPEDQRAALVLAELGALSHEEIGTTLGVRKDKVKALVFQARESLASSRKAREADCREIQEQLAVLRGGSLRRTTLRRHVEVCPACAAFKAEVQRQRSAMACLLPVAPSLALKESVLGGLGLLAGGGAAGGAAGGGGAIAGGLLAAGSGKALVAKVATIAVVAGGATGGGLMAVDEISNGGRGNTATAMAGVPPEQRSVELVGALRERATRTAAKREADRRAGGGAASPGARPAPSGPAGTTGEPSTITAGDRRARPAVEGRVRGAATRHGGIKRESRGPTSGAPRVRDEPPAQAPPAAPPAQDQAPAQPGPPPSAPAAAAPSPPQAHSGDGKRGKGHEKARGKGHHKGHGGKRGRIELPAVGPKGDRDRGRGDAPPQAPVPAPPPVPAPEAGRDDDDDHGRRGRGRWRDRFRPRPPKPRVEAPAPPPVPQPQPQPAPAPGDPRGHDHRGRRDGDGDGKRRKHGLPDILKPGR